MLFLFLTLALINPHVLAEAHVSPQSAGPLEHLRALVGGTWVCTSWDGEEPRHSQTFRLEPILDGNGLRETMEKPEINFSREVLYYWDPEREQTVSLTLTNNGFLGYATISWEEDRIVMLVKLVGPDGRSMEQKETMELLSTVSLRSVSYVQTEDGWRQRHVLEYERRERS